MRNCKEDKIDTKGILLVVRNLCFKWCNRFEESVDLILTTRVEGRNQAFKTEKTLTLISEPLDEDSLLRFFIV